MTIKARNSTKRPSKLARTLAATALNHCVSYHNAASIMRLAHKMQYVLDTGKKIGRHA